jgi:hypothetical protein
MVKKQKMIRLVRESDIEKERRKVAEREARVLRVALIRWHQQKEATSRAEGVASLRHP